MQLLALLRPFYGAEALIEGYLTLEKNMQRYLNAAEIEAVNEAVLFGAEAHSKQKRATGEPYFIHPLAVADILATQNFDVAVLQAALLHDVIEDTPFGYEDIQKRFGKDVAEIVEGVTKLHKLKDKSAQELAAGSFMKMMVALTNDPRVILIKLADRLHNMQTLGALDPGRRHRIATETMNVYVKLAEHLGLYYFRMQLEDLAFSHLHPWRAAVIQKHYEQRYSNHHLVQTIQEELAPDLKELNIEAIFIKRRRYLWGIYQRMKRKNSFAEALRTMPMRIITQSEDDCYRILGRLHKHYRPVEGKFQDFIASPKKNGYQSLHTSVVRNGHAINVQIRSQDMDKMAEMGIISLWHSKHQAQLSDTLMQKTSQQLQSWLNINLQMTQDPLEFYEIMKQELTARGIHVYTPRGAMIDLPHGATAVDFAYALDGYLGDHCAQALVNGSDYPLNRPLRNGQTVEIKVDSQARPQASWLQSVVSERARLGIRNYLARMAKQEALLLGKQLLESSLQRYGLAHQNTFAALKDYLKREELDEETLFIEIGQNKRSLTLLLSALLGQVEVSAPVLQIQSAQDKGVHLCDCCYPLPQEALRGRFDLQSGIQVHRADCHVATLSSQEEWVQLEWAAETQGVFIASLEVEVQEGMGLLAEISGAIADEQINIQNIAVDTSPYHAERRLLLYWLEVKDLATLQCLMQRLRRIAGVMTVRRDAEKIF